jgi:hypothetical protein
MGKRFKNRRIIYFSLCFNMGIKLKEKYYIIYCARGMTVVYLENAHLNITLLNWFLENNTCQVDEETRNKYLSLKNNIEGWKKGTNLRQLNLKNSNHKLESDKIKENLSLFLNQLSKSNFNLIEKKIKLEIENSSEAENILLDLILNIGLQQENNLELLITLVANQNLMSGIINKLIQKLDSIQLVKIDQSNYNQICIDTRNNLIFKNSFILLSIIFNRCNLLTIETIKEKIAFLETKITTDEKENVEKYMEILIDILKRISEKLKKNNPLFFEELIAKLIAYKNDKIRFTNRTRFAIMDYFDNNYNDSYPG